MPSEKLIEIAADVVEPIQNYFTTQIPRVWENGCAVPSGYSSADLSSMHSRNQDADDCFRKISRRGPPWKSIPDKVFSWLIENTKIVGSNFSVLRARNWLVNVANPMQTWWRSYQSISWRTCPDCRKEQTVMGLELRTLNNFCPIL